MEREEILNTIEIDEDFLIVEPFPEGTPTYRLHDLFEYARKKGVEPKDLTEEELEQFIIK